MVNGLWNSILKRISFHHKTQSNVRALSDAKHALEFTVDPLNLQSAAHFMENIDYFLLEAKQIHQTPQTADHAFFAELDNFIVDAIQRIKEEIIVAQTQIPAVEELMRYYPQVLSAMQYLKEHEEYLSEDIKPKLDYLAKAITHFKKDFEK